MTNEQRAEQLIQKYGFTFSEIPKQEIRDLLEDEIAHFQEGSSEYIRLLCGYLYCIGDSSDAALIEKANKSSKYNTKFYRFIGRLHCWK